jgi:hypothetical protein
MSCDDPGTPHGPHVVDRGAFGVHRCPGVSAEVSEARADHARMTDAAEGLSVALTRVTRERDAARAEVERLADERENIHTRLLDALERTGWIEPEQRDRFDPLTAAVFAADALTQSANAKQAVMQVANDTNARLRTLLLSALGVEDDDRTGPDEYIRRLVAQHHQAVRDRDGARDALRRVQERYDEVRAERDRLQQVYAAARDLVAAERRTPRSPTRAARAASRFFAAVDAHGPDAECPCEAYDCAGECCGVGRCSCTPAPGDPHPRGEGPAPVPAEDARLRRLEQAARLWHTANTDPAIVGDHARARVALMLRQAVEDLDDEPIDRAAAEDVLMAALYGRQSDAPATEGGGPDV